MRNLLWGILILCIYACSSSEEVRVAVAANLYAPLEEVCGLFEAQAGWRPQVVAASSGVLTAQIINQAPFDLFISANEKYPLRVQEAGLALDSPRVLILGQLVFWSREAVGAGGLVDFLKEGPVRSLALPNPDLAPYGRLAMDWLKQNGLIEAMSGKLVIGENVGHTNSILYSGAVDAGFTANSAMQAKELKGNWLRISTAPPIPQTMVLLKDNGQVHAFRDFLFSAEAQAVFDRYGYLAP